MIKYCSLTILLFSQFIIAQTIRNVGDFSTIRVYDKIQVELVPSSQPKVEIMSKNDDDIEVVNKNGELKIRMTTAQLLQGDGTKVKVYFDNISELQASQGSEISSKQTIQNKNLSLISNEGSKIKLNLRLEKLNVKANSGGQLNLTGTADRQDIVVNSGAQFFGAKLQGQEVEVSTNAGGFAEVNAEESVVAKTRAGGNIDIYGNPKDRDVKKILGGKVTFKK